MSDKESGQRLLRSPLFRTIFFALSLLSVLIIVLFSTFFSRRVRANLDRELELRNREILSRDADTLEFSLEWTARSLSQILWRSEFLRYAVIPTAGDTETESAILTQLKIFSAELPGMDRVWYEVPLRGTVFSNLDAGTLSASDFELSLRPYSSEQELWSSEDPGLHTVWTLRDGPEHLMLRVELRLARDTTSFLLCLLITRAVYAPISRLMETVRTDGTTMKAAEPLVLQPMLLDLCRGKDLEETQISRILAGVDAPFGLHGIFVLVLCALRKPEDREITETEANLYLLAVRRRFRTAPAVKSSSRRSARRI